MNYKTTLVVAAIAVAAIAALGSAFPMVGTAFAQLPPLPGSGDDNAVNSCTGTVSGTNADCRNQGNQVGRENTQGDVTFED
jgi:hypothetical protein